MKKILFSFLLIGSFATYALYVRQSAQNSAHTSIAVDKKQPVASIVGVAADFSPPPAPTPVPAAPPLPPPKPKGRYRNGAFTGDIMDAYYGNVQVDAVIKGGGVSDVQFLDHPQDRSRSIAINEYAMPILTSEAIQAQSANVDVVSGATATSDAFVQSLRSALAQAKN